MAVDPIQKCFAVLSAVIRQTDTNGIRFADNATDQHVAFFKNDQQLPALQILNRDLATGDEGGRIVASGPTERAASATQSRTAKYLARAREGAKSRVMSIRNLDRLPDCPALLVRGKERDIGSITAAFDADDAFDRGEPRGVDEPPAVFDVDFENGMEIWRIQLQRVGTHRPSRCSQRPCQRDAQMGEIAADSRPGRRMSARR